MDSKKLIKQISRVSIFLRSRVWSMHALFAVALAGAFPACGGGSNDLGVKYGCEVTATTPVAWTATTAWGTPEQLFARFAGTCQAPFVWDGAGWNDTLVFTPLFGQDTLLATVAIDTNSARWKDQKAMATNTLELRPSCGGILEVDATISLVLSSGAVVAGQKVTLTASSAQAPTVATLTLAEAQFGNWIAIQKASSVTALGMQIQLGSVGASCAGTIRLTVEQSLGDARSMSSGRLASWSDNGCAEGETAVPLDVPYQGIDLRTAVASAVSPAEIPGQWSFGEATTLSLSAAPNGMACAGSFAGSDVVTIPVAIAAATADQRIQGLTGTGTIRATVAAGLVSQTQLDLYVKQSCASAAAKMAYLPIDCAITERAEMNLHMNRYASQAATDSGSLIIYQYQRGATPGHGADKVDTLKLAPYRKVLANSGSY
jgi:hypothetical protein